MPSPALDGVGPTLSHAQLVRTATEASPDGHRIRVDGDGAAITCVLQAMHGRLDTRGLTVASTAPGAGGALRLQVLGVGRSGSAMTRITPGEVVVETGRARLVHPQVVEEVTTSAEGIRQDFIICERPAVDAGGMLTMTLQIDGADITRVEDDRVSLRLAGTGRALAWHGLRVADATGRSLPARFVQDQELAIHVEDRDATYPIRIDPTFTDVNWFSMGGIVGANDEINAMIWYQNRLCIAGTFNEVGTTVANHIALWDGSSWSALGTGTDNIIYALAVADGTLYAGGRFTTAGGVPANRVARWDGTAWSSLGTGVDNTVWALALLGGDVYAGGDFAAAGGHPASRIARWDGSTWSPMSSGMDSPVWALAVLGGDLYAGGLFTNAGGTGANRVARWHGNAWSGLGTGIANGSVAVLAVLNGNLYAGGDFTTTTAGLTVNGIAQWDGTAWSSLGGGVNNTVWALTVSGTDLYAAGEFTQAGGDAANHVAKWDGSIWSEPGGGGDNTVWAITAADGTLFMGGNFTTAGGTTVNRIAQWDGAAWSSLGKGMDDGINALAIAGSDLFAGGNFTTAGDVAANRIAHWDGHSWSALGSGMDGPVHALATVGGLLYAGGDFTTADGNPANHVACWDGTTWSPLGTGMDADVRALATAGGAVYAGGLFTTADGSAADRIARWDGTSWSALGTGMDGGVLALAVTGNRLFAGGDFVTAGGGGANRIAAWDGNDWSALGTGMNNDVLALAVMPDGTLFAGGLFTTAGNAQADHIARWDGAAWTPVGSGMTGTVYALAASGGDLYAGGSFSTAGGVSANFIAQWDGNGWSGLGSGTNNHVTALTSTGGDLYAGGNFTTAGGKVSASCARAAVGEVWNHAPVLSSIQGNPLDDVVAGSVNQGTPVASLTYGLATDTDRDPLGIAVTGIATDGGPGHWQFSTDIGQTWTDFTGVNASASRLLTDAGTIQVRFSPTGVWNGSASISFRAWDRTKWDGTSMLADTRFNGGTSPFSAIEATSTVQVRGIVVTLAGGKIVWAENPDPATPSPPTPIDPQAVVATNIANLGAATLTVQISNGRPDDRLEVNLALPGISSVLTDGHDGHDLVLSLNPGITAAAIQSILRSLSFGSIGSHPTADPLNSEDRTVTVILNDGNVSSAPAQRILTIQPFDHPPLLPTMTIAVTPGLTVTEQLAGSDPEGQPLTYAPAGAPTKGEVTITPDGRVTYRNTYLDGQDDHFTATVTASGVTTAAMITVRITPPGAGPAFASRPPMRWRASQALSYTPAVTGMGGGVHYQLLPPPQIARTGALLDPGVSGPNHYVFDGSTGTITITDPAIPDGGYIRFGILAVDASHASTYQPALVMITPGANQ